MLVLGGRATKTRGWQAEYQSPAAADCGTETGSTTTGRAFGPPDETRCQAGRTGVRRPQRLLAAAGRGNGEAERRRHWTAVLHRHQLSLTGCDSAGHLQQCQDGSSCGGIAQALMRPASGIRNLADRELDGERAGGPEPRGSSWWITCRREPLKPGSSRQERLTRDAPSAIFRSYVLSPGVARFHLPFHFIFAPSLLPSLWGAASTTKLARSTRQARPGCVSSVPRLLVLHPSTTPQASPWLKTFFCRPLH